MATDDDDEPHFNSGPHTVCHTCMGMRGYTEPRLYLIQATEDTQTGMTLGEHRTCRDCNGTGKLPGLQPPV